MAKVTFKKKRILIIDGQRSFLMLLRGAFNAMDAESIVLAPNADFALASCKMEHFDFIICNRHLGVDKKNGFQFLEEIRLEKLIKPETVFMLVGADAESPTVLGSLEKQPDGYLIKPFSQAQLILRLSKAYDKRKSLRSVYVEIQREDIPGAIRACLALIEEDKPFKQSCCRLLAALYLRNGQYLESRQLLAPLLEAKDSLWANISMAQTEYLLKNYAAAITLANNVLVGNKSLVDAQDILAKSYLKIDKAPEAMAAIKCALQLSPMSLERQFTACGIARINEDFDMIKRCSQEIWEQSKQSIHLDIAHLCTYFRSILDAAEHSEDKQTRRRYQQEALFALQQHRQDETLTALNEDFDYGIFETLIEARVDYLEGHLFAAKRTLVESQIQLARKFSRPPLSMAPDSIKLMLDLGEFADASELNMVLLNSGKKLDPNTRALLDYSFKIAQQRNITFSHYNDLGSELYNEGKYQASFDAFICAQDVSPMNTDMALNLLQCNVKIMEKTPNPSLEILSSCKQAYQDLKKMVILAVHQPKFNKLKADLAKYMEVE
ncbi:MAG: DNA-binding NarL/FixJ family response regulator [Paraglaciecola sp.]|jgi:DNA-binding NarL/FixJ family response regulator